MRKILNINTEWKFIKEDIQIEKALDYKGEAINLPHTWNAIDGQDGGNDYYRGRCLYIKALNVPSLNEGQEVYLEFLGVTGGIIKKMPIEVDVLGLDEIKNPELLNNILNDGVILYERKN